MCAYYATFNNLFSLTIKLTITYHSNSDECLNRNLNQTVTSSQRVYLLGAISVCL